MYSPLSFESWRELAVRWSLKKRNQTKITRRYLVTNCRSWYDIPVSKICDPAWCHVQFKNSLLQIYYSKLKRVRDASPRHLVWAVNIFSWVGRGGCYHEWSKSGYFRCLSMLRLDHLFTCKTWGGGWGGGGVEQFVWLFLLLWVYQINWIASISEQSLRKSGADS